MVSGRGDGMDRGWNREIIISFRRGSNNPSFVIISNPSIDRGIGLKFEGKGKRMGGGLEIPV